MTFLDAQRSADPKPHPTAQSRADHVERFQERTESQWVMTVGKKAKKKVAPEAEGHKRDLHCLQIELVKLQWPTRDALTVRSRDPAAATSGLLNGRFGALCGRSFRMQRMSAFCSEQFRSLAFFPHYPGGPGDKISDLLFGPETSLRPCMK